jgi:hypothetical protein
MRRKRDAIKGRSKAFFSLRRRRGHLPFLHQLAGRVQDVQGTVLRESASRRFLLPRDRQQIKSSTQS